MKTLKTAGSPGRNKGTRNTGAKLKKNTDIALNKYNKETARLKKVKKKATSTLSKNLQAQRNLRQQSAMKTKGSKSQKVAVLFKLGVIK
jgi:hypothetical protein